MAMLVADLGAAPGPYRLVVGDPGGGRLDVAPDGGTRVRVEVTAVARGADGREVALRPVLAEFTVRGGLVTAMEARHED
jgi:hypothetical protein